MSNSSGTNTYGLEVAGLLGVVFVTLKLLGIITWSWWWVTLPFWGGIAAVLSFLILVWVIVGIIALFK